jgi:hypothetical protein
LRGSNGWVNSIATPSSEAFMNLDRVGKSQYVFEIV